jgi:hypothetical protein
MAPVLIPFGINVDGFVVAVDEVPRGLVCDCVCPGR